MKDNIKEDMEYTTEDIEEINSLIELKMYLKRKKRKSNKHF